MAAPAARRSARRPLADVALLVVGFVALAALLVPMMGCPRRRPAETVEAAPDVVVVGADSTAVARRERLERGPAVSGSLEAREHAVLRAEIGGSVVEVNAELGDETRPGQVLARIETRSLRDALASASTAVSSAQQEAQLARRQLERATRLAAAGAVAQNDRENAENAAAAATARLDEARARLAAARQQVDAATVRAPFAGVVSDRSVNAGDVVAVGAPLFSVIDPSSMRLTAQVSSDAVSELAPGKRVRFTVRGYPEETFEGAITRIAPSADAATRQIKVLVEIPNPGRKLIAGLFAEGRVAVEARDALVVPLSAIEFAGDAPHVLRVAPVADDDAVTPVDGGAAATAVVEKVLVTVGLTDERTERVEIKGGLTEGDVVLIGGARSLRPGTPVELVRATGPTAANAFDVAARP